MKMIKLRNSDLVALIDDQDFELVSAYPWDLHAKGYAYCRFYDKSTKKPRTVYMHRLILGAKKGEEGDHRERTAKLDNRRANLRLATPHQNRGNLAWTAKPKASKFKGVAAHFWRSRVTGERIFQGWRAQLHVDKQQRYLGIFKHEMEAAKAYNAAAAHYFGEFALLNKI